MQCPKCESEIINTSGSAPRCAHCGLEMWPPQKCFEELRHFCEDIAQLVKDAPCSDRGILAVMVAAHFFGVAAAAMNMHPVDGSQQLTEIIGTAMRSRN